MKIKIFTPKFFLSISFLCLIISINAQTTVYSNNFNVAENPLGGLNPGTTPTMTWTVVSTSTGYARTAQLGSSGNYLLQIRNDLTTPVAGRTYVYGDLSKYDSPFNSTLNLNTSDISWTFNIRSGRNSASIGFDDGQYASTIVLCSNGSDFLAANGYAVTLMKGTTYNSIRLVKFAGGLSANSHITPIIGPSTPESSSSYTDYFSVKVIYSPVTNKWQLFTRMDGSNVSVDPESGTLTQIGSETVDNTYTGISMLNFGFFFNHGSTSYYPTYFDNFKVVASPIVATNVESHRLNKFSIKEIVGGFSVTTENAEVRIFDSMGKMVANKQVNGTFDYKTASKGLYIIRVGTPKGFDVMKQIIR